MNGIDRTDPSGALAIEATGLKKSFGAVRVLDGVDLAVPAGIVFALLGPNGAGKTTTVRILATLTRADAGRARVAGHDVERERHRVRRSISLAGQYAAVARLIPPRTDRTAFLTTLAAQWTQLDPGQYPFVHQVAAQLPGHDDREQFLAGIDLILTGITTLR